MRYKEIKDAIQRCRAIRDQGTPPKARMQKLEKILDSLQKKKDEQQANEKQLQDMQDELDAKWKICRSDGKKLEDEIREAKEDLEKASKQTSQPANAWKGKGKATSPTSPKQADEEEEHEYEEDDEECEYYMDDEQSNQMYDDAFVEWLQKREPALHKTATEYFGWEPPPGMLDECYKQYTKEGANASALRQVLAAKEKGSNMEQWKEWTRKHVEFFVQLGIQTMPDDIRAAYGEGLFCHDNPTPAATQKRQRNASKWNRGNSRSRSPKPRAKEEGADEADDAASQGTGEDSDAQGEEEAFQRMGEAIRGQKCRLHGPYLEPEVAGGPYKVLEINGDYQYTMESEAAREEFQSVMAREVPSTNEGAGTPLRNELLQKYLLAICQHREMWRRFPEMDDYFATIEKQQLVPVEGDEEDDA